MPARPSPAVVMFISGALAAAGLCPSAGAVLVGSPDTFTDGSVQEWNGGDIVLNVLGGPAGPADRFINVATSTTSGSGSHLGVKNEQPRWAGDYLTAGINAIEADMQNLGTTTLQMRLVLFGAGNRFTSTNMITLAPGSGWQHLSFPVSPGSLTRVLGSGSYALTLANINQIMFRHDGSTPSSGGETINGKVGIDNVIAIPTPAASGLLLLAGLRASRRRRT